MLPVLFASLLLSCNIVGCDREHIAHASFLGQHLDMWFLRRHPKHSLGFFTNKDLSGALISLKILQEEIEWFVILQYSQYLFGARSQMNSLSSMQVPD